jgi:hypothetical protein
MKLELKHLAPYLPYELRCLCTNETLDGKTINNKIFILDSCSLSNRWKYWTRDQDFLSEFGLNAKGFLADEFKPILRPLSDIFKEIKVNGERYMPFEELYADCDTDTEREFFIILEDDVSRISDIVLFASYTTVEKLISMHFDVFGLIPDGLAVDINTLNKN